MKPPKCRSCGNEHWGSVCSMKSTAARNENVQNANSSFGKASSNLEPKVSTVKAPSKAEFKDQPVDTLPKPKMGRPSTGYIKAEYNRQYSADQRTIKRLGLNCTVKEWREKNGKVPSNV